MLQKPKIALNTKVPANFRWIPYELKPVGSVDVAALAKPNIANQSIKDTIAFLKSNGVRVIYALEAEHEIAQEAKKQDVLYFDVTVDDFTAPHLALYDTIFDQVIQQADNSRKVAIHCEKGMGRTGTVLTAIRLREMATADREFIANQTISSTIKLPYGVSFAPCTENVKRAILSIRNIPGNDYVVESKEQVESLCDYELHVIQMLRDQHKKSE